MQHPDNFDMMISIFKTVNKYQLTNNRENQTFEIIKLICSVLHFNIKFLFIYWLNKSIKKGKKEIKTMMKLF